MNINPVNICLWWQQDVTDKSTGVESDSRWDGDSIRGQHEVKKAPGDHFLFSPFLLLKPALSSKTSLNSKAGDKDSHLHIVPQSGSQNSQDHHVQIRRNQHKGAHLAHLQKDAISTSSHSQSHGQGQVSNTLTGSSRGAVLYWEWAASRMCW